MITEKQISEYKKEGFLVIRNLLSTEEAFDWNRKCEELADKNGFTKNQTFAPANLARFEQFHSIILEERLLEILDYLVGKKVCFTQQSDFQMNTDGGGWHRDSIDNKFGIGSDWDESEEDYDCVRVIFYLGDKDTERDYLKVLPRSHYLNPLSIKIEMYIRQKINYYLNRFKSLQYFGLPRRVEDWVSSLFMKSHTVSSKPGDCVIFCQKLYHLAIRQSEYKSAIFLSYGSRNIHSRNLRGTFRYKEKYRASGYGEFPSDFEQKLKDTGRFVEATPTKG